MGWARLIFIPHVFHSFQYLFSFSHCLFPLSQVSLGAHDHSMTCSLYRWFHSFSPLLTPLLAMMPISPPVLHSHSSTSTKTSLGASSPSPIIAPQRHNARPTPQWLLNLIKRLKRSPDCSSNLTLPPIQLAIEDLTGEKLSFNVRSEAEMQIEWAFDLESVSSSLR